MKIQQFINERHKFKVDPTYQRPAGVWSREDKQCLIDTIIRSEPMPIFFLNHVPDKDINYVVDGQQRMEAIRLFYDNELPLNKKFSDSELHGKTFNGDNAISNELRHRFLDYELTFKMLEDYDDERIRMIFSRLQRGKPLQLGERLNAKPGNIVPIMREIADHPFMKKSIAVYKGRYGNYPDAARMLFYEKHGARQMGSSQIYAFFDTYQDMDKTDDAYQNAVKILNYLAECFPPLPNKDGYAFLEKHAWVLAIYTMVRDMKLKYSLIGLEEEIQDFVKSFHGKVYSEDWRLSDSDYQKFYENVRGGWSEKIISLRRDILMKHCLAKLKPTELCDKRQISDEEKAAVFEERNRLCECCSKEFKDFREPEYHHIKHFSMGGSTKPSNIKMLCSDCHKKTHKEL